MCVHRWFTRDNIKQVTLIFNQFEPHWGGGGLSSSTNHCNAWLTVHTKKGFNTWKTSLNSTKPIFGGFGGATHSKTGLNTRTVTAQLDVYVKQSGWHEPDDLIQVWVDLVGSHSVTMLPQCKDSLTKDNIDSLGFRAQPVPISCVRTLVPALPRTDFASSFPMHPRQSSTALLTSQGW
jgi:hypothetical protein